MKRRSFLAGLLATPVVAKAIEFSDVKAAKPEATTSVWEASTRIMKDKVDHGSIMTATEVQQRWAAYWVTKPWPRINDGYVRLRVIA